MKISIEIDLNELMRGKEAKSTVPVVETEYDDQIAVGGSLWYKEFKKGEDRWFRIEGRVDCTNITFRSSPGNSDILEEITMGYHPTYGNVIFNAYPSNMYVQAIKLDQLMAFGYDESRTNFPELVE
jgi:hypothetical protein